MRDYARENQLRKDKRLELRSVLGKEDDELFLIKNSITRDRTSNSKILQTFDLVEEIINDFDDFTLTKSIGANYSERDLDVFMSGLFSTAHDVLFGSVAEVKFNTDIYVDSLANEVHRALKHQNLNYFTITTLPEFEMNWHHLEWGDVVQRYMYFCVLAARDHGKCLSKDTKVRMFDGSIKLISEIKVGDEVMGMDSTKRTVLSVNTGVDDLYRIKQTKGDDYVVNSKHIMTLIKKNRNGENEIIDIDLPDLLQEKHKYSLESRKLTGFKVAIEYPKKEVEIDPYFLGKTLGYSIVEDASEIHIEENYIINDKETRLQLLAGLIDTCGDLVCNGFYIECGCKHLIEQIKNIADSLGFHTTIGEFFIIISGFTDEIPIRIPKRIKNQHNEKPEKIGNIQPSVLSALKITKEPEKGEYVSITIDGDKRFLLADGTVVHNSYFFTHVYPIWRMFRYKNFLKKPSKTNFRNKEGYIFSFSNAQSILLLTTVKDTIENNDELRDLLFPGNGDGWAKTEIRCKNGSSVKARGFGNAVRGAHPGWIIVDDGLKDNVIYSAMQRQKSIDYLHSVIMNMIIPDGQVGVVGTPFHDADLYAELKKLKKWHSREYPSIFPDGKILWKGRYNFEKLLEKRESQGNIIFSREMLCRPIVSESSLFPFEILQRALIGMEKYTLVMNRDSFPIKLKAVAVGLDFAISANIGADYSVFTILGVDESDELWLLNQIRVKGKSFHEQIAIIKSININYQPDVIISESNQMQMIFTQELDLLDMPVIPDTTTSKNKSDLASGIPGMTIIFERGKIHFPYSKEDEYTRNVVDNLIGELNTMSFTDKGIKGIGNHDDCVMSLQKAIIGTKKISTTGFGISFA